MNGEPTIKAIETVYNGYRFRSRLEARWAVFFDALGTPWEYEKEGYDLPDIGWYLPDFWLPDQGCFVEIKPENDHEGCCDIYLAGKANDEWRNSLDLGRHRITGPRIDSKPHDDNPHGSSMPEETIANDCLRDIRGGDVIFAWINSLDCYGTLVEIGYGAGLGKQVYMAIDRNLDIPASVGWANPPHELWFAERLAIKSGRYDNPQEAIDSMLVPYTPAERKCAALSKLHPCVLVCGAPGTQHTQDYHYGRGGQWAGGTETFMWTQEYPGRQIIAGGTEAAALAAKQARFEHGANGR